MIFTVDPTIWGLVGAIAGTILSFILGIVGFLLRRVLVDVHCIKIDTEVMKTKVAGALKVEEDHTITRERVIVLEQTASAAHRRLDEYEKRFAETSSRISKIEHKG